MHNQVNSIHVTFAISYFPCRALNYIINHILWWKNYFYSEFSQSIHLVADLISSRQPSKQTFPVARIDCLDPHSCWRFTGFEVKTREHDTLTLFIHNLVARAKLNYSGNQSIITGIYTNEATIAQYLHGNDNRYYEQQIWNSLVNFTEITWSMFCLCRKNDQRWNF